MLIALQKGPVVPTGVQCSVAGLTWLWGMGTPWLFGVSCIMLAPAAKEVLLDAGAVPIFVVYVLEL